MDRHAIEAAVEMANEGLGHDALVEIVAHAHERLRYVPNGFVVATDDGPVTVTNEPGGWRVS